MLRWRLLSAGLIVSLLLALVGLDYAYNFGAPGVWLAPLAWALTLLATGEFLQMCRQGGYQPAAWAVYAGNAAIVLAATAPLAWSLQGKAYPAACPLGTLGWPLAATALAVLSAFVAEMRRYEQPGGATVHVALAALSFGYIGLLMSFLVALRLWGNNATGMLALLSLIITAKMGDTGAYTFGKLLGGKIFGPRKMAPRLSPNKTWEGAIGAVVFSCFAAWLTFAYLAPWLTGVTSQTPVWGAVAFGGVIAATGMLGDLAESLLKRDLRVKDSSRWLPGLGGVLDLLDSLLAAAPVAYLLWAAELVRG